MIKSISTITFSFIILVTSAQNEEIDSTKSIKPFEKDSLSQHRFRELDEYAKATPEKFCKSTKDISDYLNAKAGCDLEKARLIYSWIATHIHYNDRAFNAGVYPDQSPKNCLKSETAVCAG